MLKNRGAFIVYGLLWFAVAIAVSFGLSALMQALGATAYAFVVLMPASIIVTTDALLLVLRDVIGAASDYPRWTRPICLRGTHKRLRARGQAQDKPAGRRSSGSSSTRGRGAIAS